MCVMRAGATREVDWNGWTKSSIKRNTPALWSAVSLKVKLHLRATTACRSHTNQAYWLFLWAQTFRLIRYIYMRETIIYFSHPLDAHRDEPVGHALSACIAIFNTLARCESMDARIMKFTCNVERGWHHFHLKSALDFFTRARRRERLNLYMHHIFF